MLHKSAAAPLTAARSVSNKYLDSKFKHLSVFSKVYIPGVQYYGGWQTWNNGKSGAKLDLTSLTTHRLQIRVIDSCALTIPVYQTAPTGRTWLWLHQTGGASNVSEGFAI